jgi:signal transduction histidine kinase/ActR/RegA family two-component response regulator
MLNPLVRRHSLRTRFVIAVLVAVLPLLVYSAAVLLLLRSEERQAFERGLLETSRALASAVDRELQIALTATRILSASDALRDGDLGRFYEIAREARDLHGSWRSVFLVDRSGQEILSLARPFGLPLPAIATDPDIAHVLEAGEPLISGLRTGQVSGRPVIRVVVPVREERVVKYALATTLPPEVFNQILTEQRLVPGGAATIYDREGQIVGRAPDAARWVGVRAARELMAQIQGPEGVYEGATLEGTKVYAAYTRAPRSGFIATVAVPSEIAVAPSHRSLTFLLGGGGLLLLCGIGLAVVFGDRLARPVAALTRAVAALGTDTPLPPVPRTHVKEFAGVERALRRAAAGLDERWREYERRLAAEKQQQVAESHVRRLDRLQRVADAALSNVGGEDLLRGMLASVRMALDGDTATLLLVSDDGTMLEARATDGIAGTTRPARIPIGDGVAGRIAASEGGLVLDSVRPFDAQPELVPEPVRSLIGAPVRAGGRLLGAIQIGSTQACAFTPEDLALLRLGAERVAQALERERLLEAERMARAEAEAGTRMRDQFLAMLGHELRNPLAVITTAVAALDHSATSAADAARLRGMMARQAGHAARLIDELLDVARVQSGKITLDRRPVDVQEVARRALAAIEETGRHARHALRFEGESVLVSGDPTRLEQMIGNLLDNALKYTPAGGSVWLETGAHGDQAVVRVRDTGQGMAPDLLPRIFEPFVQAERASDRHAGGLGLGLTLVRELAELHAGTVDATSPGPGRGSTFTIRLPRLSAGAVLPPVRVASETGPARRILVVEDNADLRESLGTLLRRLGHDVALAPDGESALELVRASPPDVALIDIGLPGIDGYEVARCIAGSAGVRPVLVALTGYAQPADRARAAATGFDAHLAKPVEPGALVAVLARGNRRGAGDAPGEPRAGDAGAERKAPVAEAERRASASG